LASLFPRFLFAPPRLLDPVRLKPSVSLRDAAHAGHGSE
jgi:hypothetical protein